MSQTSYSDTQSTAFSGLLEGGDNDVRSFKQSEASAEVPFGVMVCQGASADAALLMVDGNSVPVGAVVHSHTYDKTTELGTSGIKPLNMLSVLNKGRIWVAVEDAVAVNAYAFVRHTANGAGKLQKGAFRSDADTANALKCRGVRFLTATSGAGFALVELDMNTDRALRGVTGF